MTKLEKLKDNVKFTLGWEKAMLEADIKNLARVIEEDIEAKYIKAKEERVKLQTHLVETIEKIYDDIVEVRKDEESMIAPCVSVNFKGSIR